MTVVMRKTVLSAPGTVTGLTAVSSGKNRVTLSWKAVSGAEGYLVYGQKDGKYGYVGMTTKGTTFSDTKALDSDYNFYWVFAYIKDSSGKMITGGCEKYVYAKGVCAAVANIKVSAGYSYVQLSWNASYGAEGYLIYGKTSEGAYGYKGMTTQGTAWKDKNATSEEYTFYWVFPYHKNASGNMVVGLTGKYAYGKCKTYDEAVTGLTATGLEKSVRLSWKAAPSAQGYEIYRKTGDGSFTYLAKTTNTTFEDTTASTEKYNYYRVYPYLTAGGETAKGKSSSYVYAKAYVKVYTLGDVTASLDNLGTMYLTGSGAMADVTDEGSVVISGTGITNTSRPWKNDKDLITKVVVGSGVTHIGAYAFYKCVNLVNIDLTNAKNLESLGSCTFAGCTALTDLVVPENTLKSISSTSFSNCSLTNLTLGEGLRFIESNAFYNNINLKSVTLPASLEDMPLTTVSYGNPFGKCTSLQTITVASGSKYFYVKDGVLYQKKDDKVCLVFYPYNKTVTSYSIPSDVNVIKYSAFSGRTDLMSVYFPASVTEIQSHAFAECSNLTTLTGMANVEIIDDGAFVSCSKLSSVPNLPNIKLIGWSSFAACYALTVVNCGNKLETIRQYAFRNTGLKSFVIPASIKEVGPGVFPDDATITVPDGVYRLGDGSYIWGELVPVSGTRRYAYAYEVLDLVNQERAKAGLSPLTMDTELLEAAMVRGAEITYSFSHTRPSGASCFTINSKISGENIARGQRSPESVMNSWMNSSGHRANILESRWKSVGIACFETSSGNLCWVQVFSSKEATAASQPSDRAVTEQVLVKIDIT